MQAGLLVGEEQYHWTDRIEWITFYDMHLIVVIVACMTSQIDKNLILTRTHTPIIIDIE